jgi:HTH-type transcriptional regulator/antitoxin HigA
MIKRIRSNKQYEYALARVYSLMQKDIKVLSKESDELEGLSILVEQYEKKYFPIPKPKLP